MDNSVSLRISKLSFREFINCFSLFVVLGSVSTSYFFVQFFNAKVGLSFYWLLGTTIWIIYSLDHVIDGLKKKEASVSIRHLIHYKYRRALIPMVSALAVFNLFIAWFFLPQEMLNAGLVLAGLVGLYFGVIHGLKLDLPTWTKELFVSLIVGAGMVVMPGLAGDLSWATGDILVVGVLMLINFTNLLLFSFFDYESDVQNGLQSAATYWGKEKTQSMTLRVMGIAFFIALVWTFVEVHPSKIPFSIASLLMLNILLALYVMDDRFAAKENYRFWGDFIYLIPGPVWMIFDGVVFF